MAFLATVIAFAREMVDGISVPTVKVDRGGGNVQTLGHFAAPGDDSPPLPDDVPVVVEGGGSGNAQAVGYQDPKNAGKALPGEKIFIARSPDGTPVLEIWMKRSGELRVESFEGAPVEFVTDGAFNADSPDCRIGRGAGSQAARVGDLCAGTTASIYVTVDGAPIPVEYDPTGILGAAVPVAAQIISGSPVTKVP